MLWLVRENSARTQAVQLWDEMSRAIPPYPTGVVPVPELIPGTAFFPAGLGLLVDEYGKTARGIPEVMVVGQDPGNFNSSTQLRSFSELCLFGHSPANQQ